MKKLMKPLFAIALFAAFFSINQAFAQLWTVGPRIGLNGSNMSNVNDSDPLTSPSFGVFAIYSDVSHFGFGAELYALRTGFRKDNSTAVELSSLDYARLPLTGILFFNEYTSKVRPKLFAGPYAGYLMRANVTGEVADREFTNFDVGVVVGAGVNFEIRNAIWINTDIRYNHGLVDVMQNTAGTQSNQNLSLNAGVGFGF